MVPWHNTFFRCEFMRLDQNHSREDPGGLTVCHKSGWTSGWFKTSYISKGNMVSGIPRCRLPFAQDQAPCSTPSCSHSDPASVNQRKCLPALQTICHFCHTLALFYLLGSYFRGTRQNSETLPSSITLCSAVTLQTKTPGLPHLDYQSCPNFWLPGGFTILLTAESAAPGATSGPATSALISILSAWAAPCCMPSVAESKDFPHVKCLALTTQPPTRVWSVQIQALVALLRMKVKRSCMRCLLWGNCAYFQEAVALGHVWLYQEGNWKKTPP